MNDCELTDAIRVFLRFRKLKEETVEVTWVVCEGLMPDRVHSEEGERCRGWIRLHKLDEGGERLRRNREVLLRVVGPGRETSQTKIQHSQ